MAVPARARERGERRERTVAIGAVSLLSMCTNRVLVLYCTLSKSRACLS